jgi:hypothetical protein
MRAASLRSLRRQGLIRIAASTSDRRVRWARSTVAGRAEREELDRRSDEVAWSCLEPLPPKLRVKLVATMAEVERLFRASLVRVAPEDPTSPAARWCLRQYFSELDSRFRAGFDPARSTRPTRAN